MLLLNVSLLIILTIGWLLSFQCAVHGHVIGTGSGVSIGNAKYVAATQALQYLRSLPPRHPLFSLQ